MAIPDKMVLLENDTKWQSSSQGLRPMLLTSLFWMTMCLAAELNGAPFIIIDKHPCAHITETYFTA